MLWDVGRIFEALRRRNKTVSGKTVLHPCLPRGVGSSAFSSIWLDRGTYSGFLQLYQIKIQGLFKD